MKQLLLFVLGILFLTQSYAQEIEDFQPLETPPTVKAVKVEGKIAIDGKLDEADWEKAETTSDFFRKEPRQGGDIRYTDKDFVG